MGSLWKYPPKRSESSITSAQKPYHYTFMLTDKLLIQYGIIFNGKIQKVLECVAIKLMIKHLRSNFGGGRGRIIVDVGNFNISQYFNIYMSTNQR